MIKYLLFVSWLFFFCVDFNPKQPINFLFMIKENFKTTAKSLISDSDQNINLVTEHVVIANQNQVVIEET